MHYSTDDILRISRNMIEYGGSFAQHIGKALLVADSGNRARLEQAFPELLEKYFKFLSS